ncbi:hypothetical protein [Conexibacter sp. CPCC 206217]|uniref:hypothetical protein n=1 Tax=Conexibacter sp. CPCC 206217 TaxID=3064574 RepID=UPI0027178DBF|nr:hypothetical protein [Conexibacter sp. CPCC 206217]MDO8212807.1 hypothetical protein [Conexibacter sp. CPCC 206217]
MVLALAATGIVIVALLGEVMLPRIGQALEHHRARRRRIPQIAEFDVDPGRERRAEARARQLLKSCVNDEEWAMYRDLGFIRVWAMQAGRDGASAASGRADRSGGATDADGTDGGAIEGDAAAQAHADQVEAQRRDAAQQAEWERMEGFEERPEVDPRPGPPNRGRLSRRNRLSRRGDVRDEPYAYLVYPHKPILAYVPQTGRLLNEFCVEFPDQTRPYGSARLPDSDDVLAKWMALTGDEQRLIGSANMHLPGRQIDPRQVKRDLWRLRQWERERARTAGTPTGDTRVPSQ